MREMKENEELYRKEARVKSAGVRAADTFCEVERIEYHLPAREVE